MRSHYNKVAALVLGHASIASSGLP
jgi:hypothetical protein